MANVIDRFPRVITTSLIRRTRGADHSRGLVPELTTKKFESVAEVTSDDPTV